MSVEKLIKIGVESDGKGLDPINRAVRSLSAELQKLNKLVQGINISGGQGGKSNSPLLEKVVKEESALRKLYKTTNETAGAIDRVFNKAAQAQAREIEALTKKLELLNAQSAKQQKFLENAANFKSAKGQAMYDRVLHQSGLTDKEIANAEAKRRGLLNDGNNINFARLGSAAFAAATFGVNVGASAQSMYKSYIDQPFQFGAQSAQGLGATLYRQGLKGDISLMFELSRLQGGHLTNAQAVADAGGNAAAASATAGLASLPTGAVKSAILGSPGSLNEAIGSLRFEGMQAVANTAQLERARQEQQIDVKYQSALQDVAGNIDGRLNAYRLFGGQAQYQMVRALGNQAYLSEGQSQGLQAQLASMLGSGRGNQVFGAAANAPNSLGISTQSAAGLLSGIVTGAGGSAAGARSELTEIFRKAFTAGLADSQIQERVAQKATEAAANSVLAVGGRAGAGGIENTLLSMLAGSNKDMAAVNLARATQQGIGATLGAESGPMATIRDIAFNKLARTNPFAGRINSVMELTGLAGEFGNSGLTITDFDKQLEEAHGMNDSQLTKLKTQTLLSTLQMSAQFAGRKGLAQVLGSGDPNKILSYTSANPGDIGYLSKLMGAAFNPEAVTMGLNGITGKPADQIPYAGDFNKSKGAGTLEYYLAAIRARGAQANFDIEENNQSFQGNLKRGSLATQNYMNTTQSLSSESLGDPVGTIHNLAEAIKQLKTVSDQFVNEIGPKIGYSVHTNASTGGLGGGLNGP